MLLIVTEFYTFLRDNKINNHGSSPCQTSFGSNVEVINCLSSHERQLTMSMGINASRNHKFSTSINDLGSTRDGKVGPYILNDSKKRIRIGMVKQEMIIYRIDNTINLVIQNIFMMLKIIEMCFICPSKESYKNYCGHKS